MLFIISVAVVVLGLFTAAGLFLPIIPLIAITALAAVGIAYAAHKAATRDEVAGSMGVYGTLLLSVAVVALWAVRLIWG